MAKQAKLTAKVGQRTAKGTMVTQKMQDAANADLAGIEVIQDNTQEIVEAIGTALVRALEAIGIEAEGDVKELVPVDTGRLRNSITHAVDEGGKYAIVGTNVEYAESVEFNEKARHSNGQAHFLRDGVTNNLDKYRQIVEREMKGS